MSEESLATDPADPDLLRLRDVTVRFGGLVALDAVSLSVPPGRVTGVIGPNGAGKTTLFNVVCGFVRPQAGELRWRGRVLSRHRPHDLARLGIARTLQGVGLFPGLTVLENVMVGADRHARAGFLADLLALPRADRDERALRERALARLESLGVAEVADRLPGELSYGVCKRVALARALVGDPDLLLLDEPAAGLSAGEIAELAELIRGLRDDLAVVLVEHHMDLVMDVCDRVLVLDFGKVIAHGTPAEVRDDPAVVAAYLGEEVRDADAEAGGTRQSASEVPGA
ncbi:ABC transporter ATP-binding protein [Actinomadura rubrobrunea]|uniref:ABC transporter ATP-binding protein n=1 Tax=Actinomadura rubrobrunea TaxID=115335 RepID=A0A9W6PY13_9ACTN|nr:ABC transporter ATP-binding protein [Actinomadura rubrobrunea]GLW66494.1 ABC transporter ATP-binding protein [Actinomadura rubrobrunea]